MERSCIALILVGCLAAFLVVSAGGWETIKEPKKQPHIKQLSDFAVTAYNKKANVNFMLTDIFEAQMQKVIPGIKYRLVLEAKTKNTSEKCKVYEAVVVEEAVKKTLVSFKFLRVSN